MDPLGLKIILITFLVFVPLERLFALHTGPGPADAATLRASAALSLHGRPDIPVQTGHGGSLPETMRAPD
jgi:hypothetical protein